MHNVDFFVQFVLFTAATLIVGFFDNKKFFCGSQDLIHAIEPVNETVFCTITGTTIAIEQGLHRQDNAHS